MFFLATPSEGVTQEEVKPMRIRKPAAIGFYPGGREACEVLLLDAKKVTEQKPSILIVPHAGYIYSGQAAAAAFKQMDRDKIWARVTFYKETKKRKD